VVDINALGVQTVEGIRAAKAQLDADSQPDKRFFKVPKSTKVYFYILPPWSVKANGFFGKVVFKWWFPKAWKTNPVIGLKTWNMGEKDPIEIAVEEVQKLSRDVRKSVSLNKRAHMNILLMGREKYDESGNMIQAFTPYEDKAQREHLAQIADFPTSIYNEIMTLVMGLGEDSLITAMHAATPVWVKRDHGERLDTKYSVGMLMKDVTAGGPGGRITRNVFAENEARRVEIISSMYDLDDDVFPPPENTKEYDDAAAQVRAKFGAEYLAGSGVGAPVAGAMVPAAAAATLPMSMAVGSTVPAGYVPPTTPPAASPDPAPVPPPAPPAPAPAPAAVNPNAPPPIPPPPPAAPAAAANPNAPPPPQAAAANPNAPPSSMPFFGNTPPPVPPAQSAPPAPAPVPAPAPSAPPVVGAPPPVSPPPAPPPASKAPAAKKASRKKRSTRKKAAPPPEATEEVVVIPAEQVDACQQKLLSEVWAGNTPPVIGGNAPNAGKPVCYRVYGSMQNGESLHLCETCSYATPCEMSQES